MGQNLHLRAVKGRYVFRRRVPLALVAVLGRHELVKSIGACEYRDAQRHARRLATAADRLFLMLTNSPDLTREQIDELARSWFRQEVERGEDRLSHQAPDGPDELRRQARTAQERVQGYQALVSTNGWEAAAEVAADLLEAQGIAFNEDDPTHRELCRKVLRASLEAAKVYAARQAGDYGAKPSDPLFLSSAPVAAPQAPRQAPPPADDAPKLFSLIDLHLKAMAREWTPQTKNQNETTFRMFKEWLGNRPVSQVARKDVSGFIDALASLPAKYGQLRPYRNKTIREMVKLAEREDASVGRLTQKTINRHLSALSGLFTWARKHGHWEGANPAEGFIDKAKADTGPKRRRWRQEELKTLFTSSVWKGRKVTRDGRFWLPLLALYTGARREELAKLTVQDIRETAGLWVMDIVGNEHGRVKETASNRTVPLHPMLIKIGFIRHVQAVKGAGGGMLFPDLKRGGIEDKLGANFGKWFTRHLADIGLREPGLSFHSFRHNMATALRGVGVSEAVAADILGHAHKGITYRVYAEGASLAPLAEAIGKVEYGVDLSHLY